jgi:hypothetical protein
MSIPSYLATLEIIIIALYAILLKSIFKHALYTKNVDSKKMHDTALLALKYLPLTLTHPQTIGEEIQKMKRNGNTRISL